MPKKTYRTLQHDYPVCQHAECPMAATCLHQLAYHDLLVTENYLKLINPQRCTTDGKCRFFRDSKPVRYALGFTHFQERMFPQQYKLFKDILISEFSSRPYYERRSGTRPIPPAEQKIILNALHRAGVKEEMDFDAYEEIINWYD